MWSFFLILVYAEHTAKSLQPCPTLCDPIDGSPPGSPVAGILQARVLEVGAIAISVRGAYPAATSSSWNGHEGQSRGDGGSHASSCTNFPRMHWMSHAWGRALFQAPFTLSSQHSLCLARGLSIPFLVYPFPGIFLPLGKNISNSFLERERRERNVYKS